MKNRRKEFPISTDLNSCLSFERQAVCALTYCGVALVCAYLDFVERAVVIAAAVMLAVVDCTADVLVCKFSSHNKNFLS